MPINGFNCGCGVGRRGQVLQARVYPWCICNVPDEVKVVREAHAWLCFERNNFEIGSEEIRRHEEIEVKKRQLQGGRVR